MITDVGDETLDDATAAELDAGPDYVAEQAAGRRQARDVRAIGRETVRPGAPSWWVGKSRADLTAEAEARAEAMSKTREGRLVAGRINTP